MIERLAKTTSVDEVLALLNKINGRYPEPSPFLDWKGSGEKKTSPALSE